MAEVKITDLPLITEEDFTSNDRFVIVDDGSVRAMSKAVLESWISNNLQGEQGIQGVRGTDGVDGAKGQDGVDGSDGSSAYQLAVSQGYSGTLSQWLVSLKGATGGTGTNGLNGWSPLIRTQARNNDIVLQLHDWVGGTGVKPTTTGYLGSTGIVTNIANATNVRGTQGAQGTSGVNGWSPLTRAVPRNDDIVLELYDWIGGTTNKPATTGYLGSTGIVANINDALNVRGTNAGIAQNEVLVNEPQDLQNIDSSKVYKIDGVIDFTGTGLNIVVPSSGFTYRGLGSGVSKLKCDDSNYTLFTSPVGGSGNILGNDCSLSTSGLNSKVYSLVDSTGFNAVELVGINYDDCTSLGSLDGYRQGLEVNTGRFGGKPELELRGTWLGGFRQSTSIINNIEDVTAIFKAGTGFNFSGRFQTDVLANMPTLGALIDFSDSNVVNDESLIINGARVTRGGIADSGDTTLYPNIDHKSVKSNWSNNTGMPNTKKYIKSYCSAEIATTVSDIETYYPLLGTMVVEKATQLSMPVNGQYELLTGDGLFNILGTIQIKGNSGELIDLRVTLSDDNFSTVTEVNHIQLEISNLTGSNDFATFSVNFIQELRKGDRLRLEVENKTSATNVTMGSSSFLIISKV